MSACLAYFFVVYTTAMPFVTPSQSWPFNLKTVLIVTACCDDCNQTVPTFARAAMAKSKRKMNIRNLHGPEEMEKLVSGQESHFLEPSFWQC
jgi:hypothetical protein